MVCLGITGAMRTASTAAVELFLRLPPLHLQLEAEAKIGNYRLRCNEQWKLKSDGFGHSYMTLDMEKQPILQMGSGKTIPKHVYDKSFTIRFPDRSEWKKGLRPDNKWGLIWNTDGSTEKKTPELRCIAMEQGGNLVLALGNTQQ
jgi:hypothetical protein